MRECFQVGCVAIEGQQINESWHEDQSRSVRGMYLVRAVLPGGGFGSEPIGIVEEITTGGLKILNDRDLTGTIHHLDKEPWTPQPTTL